MKKYFLKLVAFVLFFCFIPSSNSIAQNDPIWYRIGYGLWGADVLSISIDPQNPDIIYIVNNGTVSKSINAGESWRRIPVELPEQYSSPTVIAVDPHNSNHILLGTRNSSLYESLNGGEDWKPIDTGPFPNAYTTSIAFDPLTSGTIYVGGKITGLFKTIDAGETWTKLNTGSSMSIKKIYLQDFSAQRK